MLALKIYEVSTLPIFLHKTKKNEAAPLLRGSWERVVAKLEKRGCPGVGAVWEFGGGPCGHELEKEEYCGGLDGRPCRPRSREVGVVSGSGGPKGGPVAMKSAKGVILGSGGPADTKSGKRTRNRERGAL